MGGLPVRRSLLNMDYFLVLRVLIEGEVEIENGFFEKLGKIYFLSACTAMYLY